MIGLAPAAGAAAVALAQGRTYTKVPVGSGSRIDTQHSRVGFRILYLVGRVRGQLTDWQGLLVTRNEVRGNDLRSPRFLFTDSFPLMTFERTGRSASASTGLR